VDELITRPSPGRMLRTDGAERPRDERVHVDGKSFARGGQRFRVQGVTFGPFAPDADGAQFPSPRQVEDDFASMASAGVNAIRTYHVPPEWLLGLAEDQGMAVLIDVPWRKHLCFLDGTAAQREAREAVRQAAKRGQNFSSVFAYSIGNEIPPDVLRWHGWRRVARFLAELRDVVKQVDPNSLVTYASYPPTEYLDLSFLDFATFNVYLHDREAFRRYLFRLQNLIGDKPLLLGELGMDTLRNGETTQAEFLAGHVTEARLMGLAGAFVFAWTDDWHTGGHRIENWAFGITHADRAPKAAYHALREVFESVPSGLLPAAPRVSVVVCSYNGGRTLEQCLKSLLVLNYPDYEVIVVDDGSTDDTPAILDHFPRVRVLRQPNHGLSVARNVGLHAATGEIVAYTDSDCFVDPDWLTHLVYQLQRSGADAVGGPNLTPEDGWQAACVAASPRQPTHVLESDQLAEHVPGCNMAFRRDALLAINGFDPIYRKAGDDVDVCWRLQQAGRWITFAPGAFVWHHRRQGPRTYLRQQAGYGEAEALLYFKHPDKFNSRGDGKWRGVMYGAAHQGLRLGKTIIYRGIFASGLFQCVYQPGPAHWAMLPSTLEWHAVAGLVALAGLFWWPAWPLAAAMLGLSLLVAILQAAQTQLAPRHDSLKGRCLVAALCYFQPLIRSWARYRTRLLSYSPPSSAPELLEGRGDRLPILSIRTVAYWTEESYERTELLGVFIARLMEHRWGLTVDSGWSDWDAEVHCRPWVVLQVRTAQEDHGGGKRLIRVHYRQCPSGKMKALGAAAALIIVAGFGLFAYPVPVGGEVLLGVGLGVAGAFLGAWLWGASQASRVMTVFDAVAARMKLVRCDPSPRPESTEGR
jgi:O-antigen biosynthesis protein